jgi:Domain of unknown function (DUF4926)
MFKEYERFRLRKPIVGEAIPVGTTGVVVMVFLKPSVAYEVEFPDGTGGNLGSKPTFTLTEAFMEAIGEVQF